MFNYETMKIPSELDFPKGTRFYIKEYDAPLARVPNGGDVIWYNWFGGEARKYEASNLSQDNSWETESFDEWKNLIIESVGKISEYRINKKYIVPSYWALFILLPAFIIGCLVVFKLVSKWCLVLSIILLMIVGEHGLRWWEKRLKL